MLSKGQITLFSHIFRHLNRFEGLEANKQLVADGIQIHSSDMRVMLIISFTLKKHISQNEEIFFN